MEILFLIGRILYGGFFTMSGLSHFMQLNQLAPYAESKGVPAPKLAVIVTGILLLIGGLSILLGYQTLYGIAALVIFLVPTTLMMHNFWAIEDPMQSQIEMIMFMKNLGLMGGALLIYYFGSGPLSLEKSNN